MTPESSTAIAPASATRPRRFPICGVLSVAAPFLGWLMLHFVPYFHYLDIWLLIPLSSPVWGILVALNGFLRRERSPALLWLGLLVNVGAIAYIWYALSQLTFRC